MRWCPVQEIDVLGNCSMVVECDCAGIVLDHSLSMHPYQQLIVWQRAHALAASLYESGALDESHRYRALVDQIRRCAGSIAANIAEGAGSGSQSSFARYLGISLASAHELESHLLLARDVGCATPANSERFASSIESIKRMLTALHRRVKNPTRPRKNEDGGYWPPSSVCCPAAICRPSSAVRP